MWFTLDGGRRIQVKKEDVELLLCADAQGSVEGRVYAVIRIMMNSKTMMDDLSYHTIVLPRLIGYDQCIADQKGIGMNSWVFERLKP